MGEAHTEFRKLPLPHLRKPSSVNLTVLEEQLIQNVNIGCAEITIEKEFRGGYSGTRVFLVLPVDVNGTRHARVVTKIGPKSELREEKQKYDKFVRGALPFTATQVWQYYERDDHDRAALNYVYVGDGILGKTLSLEEYYQTHTAEEVQSTLKGLLEKALGPTWYGQSQPLSCLFGEEYGRHLLENEKLEEIVKAIFPNILFLDDNRIRIPGLDGSYRHPLKVYPSILNKILQGRRSFVHGDLHLRNVLVDESGRGWLIDFAKVKERHNLFDFVKLETYIRLMALARVSSSFSLNEYVQFEWALNVATLGDAPMPPANLQLAKAFNIIQTVRRIARKYMGPEPNFKDEYSPALFLYSLSMLKYFPVNGPVPTQLMFITACSVAVGFFDELKAMKPISNEDQNHSAEETMKTKTPSQGGISIGRNATGNIIVSGNQNKINHTTRHVNTGDGAHIQGNVNVQNHDFVDGNKVDKSIKFEEDFDNTNNSKELRVDVAVPRKVFLDHSFVMAVAIRQKSSLQLKDVDLPKLKSGNLKVDWPKDVPYIQMCIQISAPECEILGNDTVSFNLVHNQDSPVFHFMLVPQKPGPVNIVVNVYQALDCLGSAYIKTIVGNEQIANIIHKQFAGSAQVNVQSLVIYIDQSTTVGNISNSSNTAIGSQASVRQIRGAPEEKTQRGA